MINVTGPDGSSIAFPEGTPQSDIVAALSQHYGGSSAAAAPNGNVSRETPGMVEGVGRAAATGVPIAGGLANKLDAATNAVLAPLLDKYLPDTMEKLPEGTFSERYAHALKIQNAKDKSFGEAHPVVATAAELAGGAGGLGAAIKAAPIIVPRALGLTGETLPQQVVAGASGGAALGAADTAARGGDVGQGAEIGALTGAAAPVAGRLIGKGIQAFRGLRSAPPVPANEVDIAGTKVPQTLGQATGDTEAIAREQMALRGADNSREATAARNYFDQQKSALENARSAVASKMSPTGELHAENPQDAASVLLDSLGDRGQLQAATDAAKAQRLTADTDALHAGMSPTNSILATNPMEAGNIVQGAVARAREAAVSAKNAAYDALKATQGKFSAPSFNKIGDELRAAATSPDSVPITPQTTPIANQALDNIDEMMNGLTQKRDPETGRVLKTDPITAETVDNARKRLNAYYGMAKSTGQATGNWADARAIDDIKEAFDDAVLKRLTDGRFAGDASAASLAMQKARALNTTFRQTFTRQGAGDKIGPLMENIVGRHEGQALAPEAVGKALTSGDTAPLVARRLTSLFGENSPEVGAVKQGIFGNLTTDATGARLEPAKAAANIDKFLSSSSLADEYGMRQGLTEHAARLREAVPADASSPVDRAMARLMGRDTSAPPTTTDLVNYLNTTKGVSLPVKLVQRIRTEFGEGSREVAALKQGQWAYLTEPPVSGPLDVGSRAVVKRMTDFLDGPGKPLAHTMFSSEERDLIRSYRDLMERITPPPGTVNYSNTASTLGKMFRGTLDGLFAVGGLHVAGPVGMAAGVAAHSGQKMLDDVIRTAKVTKLLYGTPKAAVASQDLANSLARLSSFVARAAGPKMAPAQ